MKTAGNFVFLSAALHIIAIAMSGFSAAGLTLLWPTLVYLAIGAGLMRGLRWVSWIGFIAMLFGAAAAISASFAITTDVIWIYLCIFGANMLAAITLFGVIWRERAHAA